MPKNIEWEKTRVAVVIVIEHWRGISCDSIQICTIIIKFVCKIGVEC